MWACGLSWSLFLVLPLASWLIRGTERQNDLPRFHTHKTGIMMLFCFLKYSVICGWKELCKNYTCYYCSLPRLGETAPLCCMAHDVSSVLVVPCTGWAAASSAQCCGHVLWATAITALASSAENSNEFQMLLLVNIIYLHSLHLVPWDLTDISPQNIPRFASLEMNLVPLGVGGGGCVCEPSRVSLRVPTQNKHAGWVPCPYTKIWGARLASIPA